MTKLGIAMNCACVMTKRFLSQDPVFPPSLARPFYTARGSREVIKQVYTDLELRRTLI